MKKTNKTYEAPVAEVIEMVMPAVMMASVGAGEGSMEEPDGDN